MQREKVTVALSTEAIKLVREKRLNKPCIKIDLNYKAPVCTSSFCKKRPYISIGVVDEDSVDRDYLRVVSNSGIAARIASPLLELADRDSIGLRIETEGIWKLRRLVVEGFDMYEI